MPVITPGDKVLVTGANGFVATWLVKELLDNGYRVRGTVRSLEKGAHLHNLFKVAVESEQLELYPVPDFLAEGAFDEAVRGVDAIAHTATPVTLTADDPNDLIRPSLEGTKSILRSALLYGDQLKRFAYTSSFASVFDSTRSDAPPRIDESCWNETSYQEVLEKGRAAHQMSKYRASKVVAEKALWEFLEREKPSWDIVSLCPPLIIGPMLHQPITSATMNESNEMFYDFVFDKSPEDVIKISMAYVDVQDVALVHRLAFEKPEASNERFLIHAHQWNCQDWYDIINDLAVPGFTTHVGTPGSGASFPYTFMAYNDKVKEKLGMHFRERSDTARAFIEDIRSRRQYCPTDDQ